MRFWVILLLISLTGSLLPSPLQAANCSKQIRFDFNNASESLRKNHAKRNELKDKIYRIYTNTCRFLEKQAIRKNIKNAELKEIWLADHNNFLAFCGCKKEESIAFYDPWGHEGSAGYSVSAETIVYDETRGIDDGTISHELIHAFQGDVPVVHGTNMVSEGLTEYLATQLYGTSKGVAYHYAVKTMKAFSQALDRLGKDGDAELVQALLDNKIATRMNELISWEKYKPKDPGDAKTTWQYIQYNLLIEAGKRKTDSRDKHADLTGWLNGIAKEDKTQAKALEISAKVTGKQVSLTVKNLPEDTQSVTAKEGDQKLATKAVDSDQTTTTTITFTENDAGQHTYTVFALDDEEKRIAQASKSVTIASSTNTGSQPAPTQSSGTNTSSPGSSSGNISLGSNQTASPSITTATPQTAALNFGYEEFKQKAVELSGRIGDRFLTPQESPAIFAIAGAEIINFLLWLGGAAAVVFAAYTGIVIVTALGDEQKIASAKRNLLYLLIGVAAMALAVVIVNLILRVAKEGKL